MSARRVSSAVQPSDAPAAAPRSLARSPARPARVRCRRCRAAHPPARRRSACPRRAGRSAAWRRGRGRGQSTKATEVTEPCRGPGKPMSLGRIRRSLAPPAPCIRSVGRRVAARSSPGSPLDQHERRRHGNALGVAGLREEGRPEGDPIPRRTLGFKGSIPRSACSEEPSGWIWICPVCTREALRCRIRSAATITISSPRNATKSRMVRRLDIIAPSHAAPLQLLDRCHSAAPTALLN